ncbi:MAG: hypothetical protein AB8F74_04505 [Saprospiraceae bacterium]
MKNLQVIVAVALGLVLFSSCARGYGCPYGSNLESETKTTPIENVIPEEGQVSMEIAYATAR